LPCPHELDGTPKPSAVALGAAGMRRAEAALNAKGKVEAENGKASGGECIGNRDQEFRLAVAAGAVGKKQRVAGRRVRLMQKPVDGRVGRGVVEGVRHGGYPAPSVFWKCCR
jgi:hypothetical protein